MRHRLALLLRRLAEPSIPATTSTSYVTFEGGPVVTVGQMITAGPGECVFRPDQMERIREEMP